jgi:hypothetical protein
LWLTTRNGITVSNVYDAAGQMLATARYGTDNSQVWTYRASYDLAGRKTTETNWSTRRLTWTGIT